MIIRKPANKSLDPEALGTEGLRGFLGLANFLETETFSLRFPREASE